MSKKTAYEWLLAHRDYFGEQCLVWPFSRVPQGYGNLGYFGKVRYAHRVMCELANGAAPTPQHQACHSCGNGHGGCVSPRHLSWKTPRENQLDRRRDGTHLGGKGSRTRLSADVIADIRLSKNSESILRTAQRLGLTRGCVEYWRNTTHAPAPPGCHPETIRQRLKKATAHSSDKP